MRRHCYLINGVEDDELTTAGLWFVLTYLYSKNIDPKETRYSLAGSIDDRLSAIKRVSQSRIRSWIQYALTNLKKSSRNSGKVSLNEQKRFAGQLDKIAVLKV